MFPSLSVAIFDGRDHVLFIFISSAYCCARHKAGIQISDKMQRGLLKQDITLKERSPILESCDSLHKLKQNWIKNISSSSTNFAFPRCVSLLLI